jgi:hypothetical protein
VETKVNTPSQKMMQIPMEFLNKHGLNDQSDLPNLIMSSKDGANQLFNEFKQPLLPHDKP